MELSSLIYMIIVFPHHTCCQWLKGTRSLILFYNNSLHVYNLVGKRIIIYYYKDECIWCNSGIRMCRGYQIWAFMAAAEHGPWTLIAGYFFPTNWLFHILVESPERPKKVLFPNNGHSHRAVFFFIDCCLMFVWIGETNGKETENSRMPVSTEDVLLDYFCFKRQTNLLFN